MTECPAFFNHTLHIKMRKFLFLILLHLAVGSAYAGLAGLGNRLSRIIGKEDVGVAVITCYGDTLTVNGDSLYDLASVAKFHQAAALARTEGYEELTGAKIEIDPTTLEKNTWSPMRAAAGSETFTLSPAELLDYSLMMSDNNAADILFDHYNSPAEVDSILHAAGYPGRYRIAYTERQMHSDSLGAANTGTPLSAAAAINRFFASDTTASATLVKALMARVSPFGTGRIVAGLKDKDAKVFHKTGTGFNAANGTPAALNDLAFISFKTNWGYGCSSLAVFVRDYSGSRKEGEQLIADISAAVWDAIMVDEVNAMNASASVPAGKAGRRPPEAPKESFLQALMGAYLEAVIDNALGIED